MKICGTECGMCAACGVQLESRRTRRTQLTENFADWRYFQARPDDDEQVDLLSVPIEAFVELRVERLAKECNVRLKTVSDDVDVGPVLGAYLDDPWLTASPFRLFTTIALVPVFGFRLALSFRLALRLFPLAPFCELEITLLATRATVWDTLGHNVRLDRLAQHSGLASLCWSELSIPRQ